VDVLSNDNYKSQKGAEKARETIKNFIGLDVGSNPFVQLFVLMLMFGFIPFIVVWRAKWGREYKISATVILLIVYVVIGVNNSASDKIKADQPSPSVVVLPEASTIKEPQDTAKPVEPKKLTKEEQSVLLLSDNTGLTQEEANIVFSDLNKLGFKSITAVTDPTGDTVDTTQSFKLACDGYDIVIKIGNRKTLSVATAKGNELFNSNKGGALYSIDDFVISDDEKIAYMSMIKDAVTNVLKAPSTAKFPGQGFFDAGDGWSLGKRKKIVTISSYVDSQNSFGAMIRTDFDFQIDSSTRKVIYFRFGDQVSGKPFKD
jgi:hypothetical protein